SVTSIPPATPTAQTGNISSLNEHAAQFGPALTALDPIITSTAFPANIRASRKDKHLHSISAHSLLRVPDNIVRIFAGSIRTPCLPPFTMALSSAKQVPATPREDLSLSSLVLSLRRAMANLYVLAVISPSPTPSESTEKQDGYFGPVTRSARKKAAAEQAPIEEIDESSDSSAELARRARSRSRSPMKVRKITGLTPAKAPVAIPKLAPIELTPNGNGKTSNDHLSPASANPGWSWRDLSRSPSPLGLIPIHRQWRSFVHRHEVPRKLLHVSIGFFTIWLYVSGVQTNAITPFLLSALIPIATVDYIRHTYPAFNRFYVRVLGALMRETEYDGWNGVIWYLLGAWIALRFFPKDVGVMGVLLLSWCDTAASTVGRAYGRYTPRIRRGKSLAGSLAAFAVGVITAASFWGYLAPRTGPFVDDVDWPFLFTGILRLPATVRDAVGLTETQPTISGGLALAVMSVWTGFVASASELVDVFGWDDNLTIPVLSGVGMWAFLKVLG
ncbi:Diglyceride kinase 1, partial [Hyphodiscus hymeniophilus]